MQSTRAPMRNTLVSGQGFLVVDGDTLDTIDRSVYRKILVDAIENLSGEPSTKPRLRTPTRPTRRTDAWSEAPIA